MRLRARYHKPGTSHFVLVGGGPEGVAVRHDDPPANVTVPFLSTLCPRPCIRHSPLTRPKTLDTGEQSAILHRLFPLIEAGLLYCTWTTQPFITLLPSTSLDSSQVCQLSTLTSNRQPMFSCQPLSFQHIYHGDNLPYQYHSRVFPAPREPCHAGTPYLLVFSGLDHRARCLS